MDSILLFIAIIPVTAILLYVYGKDRNKEPTKLLVKLFIFGIVSCFITVAISEVLESIIPLFGYETDELSGIELFISVFIGIALIEEFSKWLMAYLIGYKSEEFDEVYDSIVYAIFVSLGFAFFENVLYVIYNQSLLVGALRGILSVPGHACYALYMGYYLSLAKIFSRKGRKDIEKLYLVLSVIVPTILHGIYDYCILSKIEILLLVFVAFIAFLYCFSIKRLKLLASDTTSLVIKNKFCKECGTPIKGDFCSNCGTRQE